MWFSFSKSKKQKGWVILYANQVQRMEGWVWSQEIAAFRVSITWWWWTTYTCLYVLVIWTQYYNLLPIPRRDYFFFNIFTIIFTSYGHVPHLTSVYVLGYIYLLFEYWRIVSYIYTPATVAEMCSSRKLTFWQLLYPYSLICCVFCLLFTLKRKHAFIINI